jgi:hypothetical protein
MDARHARRGFLGLARLPEIFDRRQADDSDAAPRSWSATAMSRPAQPPSAGDDDRNPVHGRSLGGDLDHGRSAMSSGSGAVAADGVVSQSTAATTLLQVRALRECRPARSLETLQHLLQRMESAALRRPCNANGNGNQDSARPLPE